jgi:hypothetical protein
MFLFEVTSQSTVTFRLESQKLWNTENIEICQLKHISFLTEVGNIRMHYFVTRFSYVNHVLFMSLITTFSIEKGNYFIISVLIKCIKNLPLHLLDNDSSN